MGEDIKMDVKKGREGGEPRWGLYPVTDFDWY
jgi:hypothetical protein